MPRLYLHNFGPIKEAKLNLRRFNFFTGPQSMGKSCILKTACHCAWTEKKLMLGLTPENWSAGDFLKPMLKFHRMWGYQQDDTRIEYETSNLSFALDLKKNTFEVKKKQKWSFRRSKISYIPAERNLVSSLKWNKVTFDEDNISSFVSDWDTARKSLKEQELDILELGFSYSYDENSNADYVRISTELSLPIESVSSGLQSLIPLALYLKYLTEDVFKDTSNTLAQRFINKELRHQIYKSIAKKNDYEHTLGNNQVLRDIGGEQFPFATQKQAEQMEKIYNNFTLYQQSDVYMEEPEAHLYPQTQVELVRALARSIKRNRYSSLSIATHSPYIMSAMNNLLQAGLLQKERNLPVSHVEKIVGERAILYASEVAAYEVMDGFVRDMIDPETGLMVADAMDSASIVVEQEFSKLLYYED